MRPGMTRPANTPAWVLAWQTLFALVFALVALPASYGGTEQQTRSQLEDLRSLSIEELMQVEVTSVSRRAEPVALAPASIYVISAQDIQRSGALNLPEALRLAPNLQVARDDASRYAISARGMNSVSTSNKLLVLVDGRSIYEPLYAGVVWDEEQVPLEDIDRIEVISGPGGTLWGANAVNGVINVITRRAQDTQGWSARASYGAIDRVASVRYGGRLTENAAFRVYARGSELGQSLSAAGLGNNDGYSSVSGGFRTDWMAGRDHYTLQGDLFSNDYDGSGNAIDGGNLVARWSREMQDGGSFILQAYYDTTERDGPGLMTRSRVGDIAFQHSLSARGRHQIVWGGGYRTIDDFFWSTGSFSLDPVEDDFQLSNLFVQDTIALSGDLSLTAGVKLEHSTYSGFDYLPSLRLSWTPSSTQMVWGAVSRAIRTPVRLDRDVLIPGTLDGGDDFDSESVIAYELGYRANPTARLSFSATAFFNEYEGLRVLSLQPGTTNGLPMEFRNGLDGTSWGVEAWGMFLIYDWWRIRGGIATLQKDFDLRAGLTDILLPQSSGNDPEYQAMVNTRINLADVFIDANLRRVGDLPRPGVPGYTELNATIGWQVTDRLEVSLSGVNLLDDSHPETSSAGLPDEIRRSVFLTARMGF